MTGAINDLLGSIESELGSVHLDRWLVPVQSLFWMAESELVGDDDGPTWFQCEPDLPPLMVDQTRMVQVIVYLATSVRRAAPSGAALAVHAHRREARIRITIGLAREQVEVGDGLEAPPLQTNIGGSVAPTWVHEELMLSVCQTVLLAHGVELCQGSPGMQEEIFWFELPAADPRDDGGTYGA